MLEKTEYKNFEKMATELLKVPHREIKEKLEAEKAAKKPLLVLLGGQKGEGRGPRLG